MSPGPEPTYTSIGSAASDVDEQHLAVEFGTWLEGLLDQVIEEGRTAAWFHYGQVEATHLRRLLPTALAEKLLAQATDLLADVVRPHFYAPGGYGLKHLAPAADAIWRTEGATGADTLTWIQTARDGDRGVWQQLVDYNEDDTRATRILREALAAATEVGWTLTKESAALTDSSTPDTGATGDNQ